MLSAGSVNIFKEDVFLSLVSCAFLEVEYTK